MDLCSVAKLRISRLVSPRTNKACIAASISLRIFCLTQVSLHVNYMQICSKKLIPERGRVGTDAVRGTEFEEVILCPLSHNCSLFCTRMILIFQ